MAAQNRTRFTAKLAVPDVNGKEQEQTFTRDEVEGILSPEAVAAELRQFIAAKAGARIVSAECVTYSAAADPAQQPVVHAAAVIEM